MGVTNFQQYIKKNYPDCIIPFSGNRIYDYIYIDVNFLLHTSLYTSRTKEGFFERVNVYLDMILNNFIATKKIILAIDGVPVYAKVVLQQQRRLNMTKTKCYNKDINPIYLTPGTKLMYELENHLNNYIISAKKKYKYLDTEIKLYPSTLPSEGELKIYNKLKKYGNMNPHSKHLVIGNDSDLVLLGMSIKPIYNINIFIKLKQRSYLISIEKLIQSHAKEMLICPQYYDRDIYYNTDKLRYENLRDDFTFMTLLIGNDYMSNLYGTSFRSIWAAYKSTLQYGNYIIRDNCSIDILVLKKFITNLVNCVPKKFRTFDIKKYNNRLVIDYIEGLLWCLSMYKTASCPKYDYVYSHDTTPSSVDILYCLDTNPNIIFTVPQSDAKPMSTKKYSLLVIPKKFRELIQ